MSRKLSNAVLLWFAPSLIERVLTPVDGVASYISIVPVGVNSVGPMPVVVLDIVQPAHAVWDA